MSDKTEVGNFQNYFESVRKQVEAIDPDKTIDLGMTKDEDPFSLWHMKFYEENRWERFKMKVDDFMTKLIWNIVEKLIGHEQKKWDPDLEMWIFRSNRYSSWRTIYDDDLDNYNLETEV